MQSHLHHHHLRSSTDSPRAHTTAEHDVNINKVVPSPLTFDRKNSTHEVTANVIGMYADPVDGENADDWGDDFDGDVMDDVTDNFNNDSLQTAPLTEQKQNQHHQQTTVFSSGDMSSERLSERGVERDALTLRAFDETLPQTDSATRQEFSDANDVNVNVIGMYADPAAEKDDWGDDFDLENFQDVDENAIENDQKSTAISATPPTLIIDERPAAIAKAASLNVDEDDDEHTKNYELDDDDTNRAMKVSSSFRANNIISDSSIPVISTLMKSGNGNRLVPINNHEPSATVTQSSIPLSIPLAELLPLADDYLPLRQLPHAAFTTPRISPSSLLMYPSVGYPSSGLHPSCVKVLELFSSHSTAIQRHFDALVRDSQGTIAFSERCRSAYLMYGDEDVVALSESHRDMAVDVLMWKLEYARVGGDSVEQARLLLSLSKFYKDGGSLTLALQIVKDGLKVLTNAGGVGNNVKMDEVAVATELEYESAILYRAVSAPAEAGRSLMHAMTHSAILAKGNSSNTKAEMSRNSRPVIGALTGGVQRGVWWQLKCKYLRAELAYDLEELDTAVQFYSEYIVESLSRMMGATPPPPLDDDGKMIGPGYMRFCLFSPRRLVLALWATSLCLGSMRNFAAAADVANLTSVVASAFAYEDASEASSVLRSRIKVIGAELKLQYDDIQVRQHNEKEGKGDGGGVDGFHDAAGGDYGVGDFGDVGLDDVVEDWDAQIERELNITIERCCDIDVVAQSTKGTLGEHGGFDSIAGGGGRESDSTTAIGMDGDGVFGGSSFNNDASVAERSVSSQLWMGRPLDYSRYGEVRRPPSGSQEGNLIEAELRQYLTRVTGSGSSLPGRLMYPKPTEPFIGHLKGPKDHEHFLRTFVRSKDPDWLYRTTRGFQSASRTWHPSAECKLNFNIDPIQDADDLNSEAQVLSLDWGMKLLDAVWKVVRSQVHMKLKQTRVKRLVRKFFWKMDRMTVAGGGGECGRQERLEVLGVLLDALRLVREVVTKSGKEARWFSSACEALGGAAATLTPAAKAAVELFQAESRAHCGVKAVVPSKWIERCTRQPVNGQMRREQHQLEVSGSVRFSSNLGKKIKKRRKKLVIDEEGVKKTGDSGSGSAGLTSGRQRERDVVPESLRNSVIDLMHALYWQTKAGFDMSSPSNSLELLLHAEVASSLFLIGSGISPVDGSAIDLSEEIRILQIPRKRKTQSVDSDTFVDETRRVSSTELVDELEVMWSSLPLSAGAVRAKISFALAHHARVTEKNYSRAERLLFDALLCMHSVSSEQVFPNRFFSAVIRVAPLSIVSSPFAAAILNGYGELTSSHSKYRYGVAALEAGCDTVRVRNKDKLTYRSSMFDVVELALRHNDWRKAICLLYSMRSSLHPKDGLRNEFLHLCVMMHNVCRDAGCLSASVVPLRAFSALIYEERLRTLLQRYKRRLAKKKRSRIRKYISGSPLPKLLPGSSIFSTKKNSLASFFEVPIVSAAVDTTIRSSASLIHARPRPSSGAILKKTDGSRRSGTGNGFLSLYRLFWPIHAVIFKRASRSSSRNATMPQNQSVNVSSNQNVSVPTEAANLSQDAASSVPQYASNEREHATSGTAQNTHTTDATSDSGRKTGPATQTTHDVEYEQEQRELLRIEAEQEPIADIDRSRVELMRVETDYALGDYRGADQRCLGLLDMCGAPEIRCKVLEVMSLIRLKRREINRCLDLIDSLEFEYDRITMNYQQVEHDVSNRIAFFRHHEGNDTRAEDQQIFIPQVTYLRLKALTHGGRLEEALRIADKALELCLESSFWDRGRLHYLRGKTLYAMSCTSTPVFKREAEANIGKPPEETELIPRMTQLTMEAFETSSRYFDAAGDDLSAAKSDLKWARTCIDFLFRRVVLPHECGGGVPLSTACKVLDGHISLSEVQQVVYNVLNVFKNANIPILLIDAMAALAEVKCIRGHPSSSWGSWVLEGWKLFSRLFTNTEDLTVVLSEIAPVSILIRLRNLCGRLVRLVMCNEDVVNVRDMNKHLRLFEAYVKLHLSVDEKMNLTSSVHRDSDDSSAPQQDCMDSEEGDGDDTKTTAPKDSVSQHLTTGKSVLRLSLLKPTKSSERKNGNNSNQTERKAERVSDSMSETHTIHKRPDGAFLHILGNEGVALGRQGVSLFINRPRKQVISAVKETGAVLIPTNFFSNSRLPPESHELGKDAELIFPFKPSLGLGAMQILNDDDENELQPRPFRQTFSNGPKRATVDFAELRSSSFSMQTARPDDASMSMPLVDEIQSVPSNPEVKRLDRHERLISSSPRSKLQLDDSMSSPRLTDRDRKAGSSNAKASSDKENETNRNELAYLIGAIIDETQRGTAKTNGGSPIFGSTTASRVWAHMHRVKAESKRFMHGEINMSQLQERNREAVLSWMHCIPVSRKEWNIPESIRRRLVYILYAHGVVGYYAVDRGGSIARIAFGGKLGSFNEEDVVADDDVTSNSKLGPGIRAPTDSERNYLSEMVRGLRDEVWHRSRDWEIVNGLATQVLKAPRILLNTSPVLKIRNRPIVLVADLALQIIPWELFFDHVVIRSHSLLDVIRSAQDETVVSRSGMIAADEGTAMGTMKRMVQFLNFIPSRKEAVDLERTEEARRQQLAFQGLLRLDQLHATGLVSFLGLGGFSDPTAMNAVARPTGPLSSPLSQSRKGVQLFGKRIVGNIGKRNFPHLEFIKVSGLGSASTQDLKDAVMAMNTAQPGTTKEIDDSRRGLGAFISVFMFSYADLVDCSKSVFGLRREVSNSILMFAPAVHMKVLARHLEDEELSEEIERVCGRWRSHLFSDVAGVARVVIEHVSRFSRDKRIPIVVFLGEKLMDVFTNRRHHGNVGAERKGASAAERMVQLGGAARIIRPSQD